MQRPTAVRASTSKKNSIKLLAEILDSPGLPGDLKFLLVALARFGDANGISIYPGVERLARILDKSDRAVRMGLRELQKKAPLPGVAPRLNVALIELVRMGGGRKPGGGGLTSEWRIDVAALRSLPSLPKPGSPFQGSATKGTLKSKRRNRETRLTNTLKVNGGNTEVHFSRSSQDLPEDLPAGSTKDERAAWPAGTRRGGLESSPELPADDVGDPSDRDRAARMLAIVAENLRAGRYCTAPRIMPTAADLAAAGRILAENPHRSLGQLRAGLAEYFASDDAEHPGLVARRHPFSIFIAQVDQWCAMADQREQLAIHQRHRAERIRERDQLHAELRARGERIDAEISAEADAEIARLQEPARTERRRTARAELDRSVPGLFDRVSADVAERYVMAGVRHQIIEEIRERRRNRRTAATGTPEQAGIAVSEAAEVTHA